MFGTFASLGDVLLRMGQERQNREAECLSHEWGWHHIWIIDKWAWCCSKCGKCDSGREPPT